MLLNSLLLIIIIFCLIEINHHLRQVSPLVLKPKEFKKIILDSKHKYITLIEIKNLQKRMEVMIPSFNVNPQLIGISKEEIIKIQTNIKPLHPDVEEEQKNYPIPDKEGEFYKMRYETDTPQFYDKYSEALALIQQFIKSETEKAAKENGVTKIKLPKLKKVK